ncbi:MAG: alkane 1-monooxygenase [Yoonia sp.]|jgi:alkane 1-monooxygenase
MIRFFTPMRLFTFATLIPVALICAAVILGGVWVLAGLIYLTAMAACLDELIHHVTPPTKDSEFPAAMVLLVTLGVAHFGLLALVVDALANGNSGFVAKVGIFIATGFFFGQISNSNAHELIHRGGRGLHSMGKWVYISLLFGHHTSAHVLVHHRYVATPLDPSTSRRGESYYKFAARAWRGSFRKGLAAETERQQRIGTPTYRHPYVAYIGGAVGFVALAWFIGGPLGATIYVALATFSTSQLLLSDYIQHYGLMRSKVDGKYEPVTARHSWNSPHWFSSAVMLNAPRHSDHHAHPSRPYNTLIIPEDCPMLPRSLPVMACLALAPRRWRKVMDPLAAQWSAK